MTISINSGEHSLSLAAQGLSSLIHEKHFPQNIALAVAEITTSGASSILSSLSRAARSVLAFVVRLAECTDPTKPSWAFKATIAKEIGVSEATVYRGLKELVNLDLIERLQQERKSHNGRLFVSRIRLMKKERSRVSCSFLGLLDTRPSKRHLSGKAYSHQDGQSQIQEVRSQDTQYQEGTTVLKTTGEGATSETVFPS